MLFMIIERFRNCDPIPVGERFREHGRMLPDGVSYHASWIDPVSARCFQVMEADDAHARGPWMQGWTDLVEFEVIPVVSSAEYWPTVGGRA
jgi:hypothetical protein